MLGDQILYFLEFFYYLLSHFENRWSNGGVTKQWNRWISNFQSGLINSKIIPKNVKFGLQAHFNIENTSNSLDRPFGLRKLKNELDVFLPKCYRKHISHSLSLSLSLSIYLSIYLSLYLSIYLSIYLYIYIYIYIWVKRQKSGFN